MTSRQAISTPLAPAAVGPYSQANVAGGFVFCAGQLGLDPATGAMVQGGAAEQADQALSNLRAVLAASGCGMDDVVKANAFLVDMADFAAVNQVWARYFQAPFPARAAVQVAALPKGALFEVEAIAVLPGPDRRDPGVPRGR